MPYSMLAFNAASLILLLAHKGLASPQSALYPLLQA